MISCLHEWAPPAEKFPKTHMDKLSQPAFNSTSHVGDYKYTLRFGPKFTLCSPCILKIFAICEAFAFYLCDTNIAQSRKRKKHKQDILENRQCFEIILNVAAATEENCLSTIW